MPTAARSRARPAKRAEQQRSETGRATDSSSQLSIVRTSEHGLILVDRQDLAPDGGRQALRSDGGAQDERHGRVGELRRRPIDHGPQLALQLVVPGVADDADDLGRLGIVLHVDDDALPHGLWPGKYMPRHGFVDHRYLPVLHRLLLVEHAAGEDGDVHGAEVLLVDDAHVGHGLVARGRSGLPSMAKRGRRAEVGKGRALTALAARTPGSVLKRPTACLKKATLCASSGYLVEGRSTPQGQEVLGFETRVDGRSRRKLRAISPAPTSSTSASADLGDDQSVAHPLAARAPRVAPARLLQGRAQVHARRFERGRQAEDDAGQERDGEGEGQHRQIDADLLRSRSGSPG